MKNIENVKAFISRLDARSDYLKMSSYDMALRARAYYILEGDLYAPTRETSLEKYNEKQKSRKAHIEKFDNIRKAKQSKTREDRLIAKIEKINEAKIKSTAPILWSAQMVSCDIKRTNIVRRVEEALQDKKLSGRDLMRLYKIVGLSLNDRRLMSKRLSSCGLIARLIPSKRLETLVKSKILKLNSRIAGIKIDKLTSVASALGITLDDLYPIYKKLSTQEAIDRRALRQSSSSEIE